MNSSPTGLAITCAPASLSPDATRSLRAHRDTSPYGASRPWHIVYIALMFVVAALALPALAGARPPLPMSGLTPDRFGATTSGAERNLHIRYPGIRVVFCVGALMRQDAAGSSFVHGLDRYWDKLVCFGQAHDGANYGLVYDQKSLNGWIIYRLYDASIADLERA